MALNIQRFKSDLEKLVEQGDKLELALLVKVHGKEEVKKFLKEEEEEFAKILSKLPSFNTEYESWYSDSLVLIRQILPDRLADFKGHFEIPKNRKDITFASYRIQDALKGLRVTRAWDEVVVDDKAAVPHFRQQLAMLLAARRRFDSSLFEIRQILQADLFDTEIDSARELLKNKLLRAAGAIAGLFSKSIFSRFVVITASK